MFRWREDGYKEESQRTNDLGLNFYAYILKQQETAAQATIPYLDQFHIPGMYELRDSFYKDGFHLTEAGYKHIAPHHLYFLATEQALPLAPDSKDPATLKDIHLPSQCLETKRHEAPIYDLAGRRLTARPKSGLYIQQGKINICKEINHLRDVK